MLPRGNGGCTRALAAILPTLENQAALALLGDVPPHLAETVAPDADLALGTGTLGSLTLFCLGHESRLLSAALAVGRLATAILAGATLDLAATALALAPLAGLSQATTQRRHACSSMLLIGATSSVGSVPACCARMGTPFCRDDGTWICRRARCIRRSCCLPVRRSSRPSRASVWHAANVCNKAVAGVGCWVVTPVTGQRAKVASKKASCPG
jgi:hypothetical protein